MLVGGAGSLACLGEFVMLREVRAVFRGYRVGWRIVTSRFARGELRLFVLVGGVGDLMFCVESWRSTMFWRVVLGDSWGWRLVAPRFDRGEERRAWCSLSLVWYASAWRFYEFRCT